MKNKLTLAKLIPMDIILEGLRPNDDWYEKKKLDKLDEIKKGNLMVIFRKEKDGSH